VPLKTEPAVIHIHSWQLYCSG